MNKIFLLVLAVLATAPLYADDWKIAGDRIKTDFAAKVNPKNPLPEYPRPQLERPIWKNLNGLWDYAIRPVVQQGTVVAPAPADEKYDGKILVPFAVESALSGVQKSVRKENNLFYKTTFTVPKGKDWEGKRILLHFEAVDWETVAALNGKELGRHKGGYTPFSFDITDFIKKDGEQVLTLGVWDPTDESWQPKGKQVRNPQGIMYTAVTGIWETVWIEAVPQTYVENLKLIPNIKDSTLTINAKINGLQDSDQIEATVLTKPKAGTVNRRPFIRIRQRHEPTHVLTSSVGKAGEPLVLSVPSPKLWTPDEPNLYDLKFSVIRDGKPVDTVNSYFGMREISVGKDEKVDDYNRILLNGKFVWQHGPLDQGWWPDGLYTAPTDEALAYDIVKTKEYGFNMLRKHVKVESRRFYYHCDKLGILVWQDMPSGGAGANSESKENFRREWKEIIETHYNSPSIIIWVPFNEGWGQYETVEIAEYTKSLDPSRLVNEASGWNNKGAGDVHDRHDYSREFKMDAAEPRRATTIGEYGGLAFAVPEHTWVKSDRNFGYGRKMNDWNDLFNTYDTLNKRMSGYITKGLSAAVYTQTTDCETEVNGLLTYDRKDKIPPKVLFESNNALRFAPSEKKIFLPSAAEENKEWDYTTEKPADDWYKTDFKPADWKQGQGFGSKGTPGAAIKTEWSSKEIWIRTAFEIPADADLSKIIFELNHDEDAVVYINGKKAAGVDGYNNAYAPISVPKGTFKAGKNTVAIECVNKSGGQFVDARVYQIVPPKDGAKKLW